MQRWNKRERQLSCALLPKPDSSISPADVGLLSVAKLVCTFTFVNFCGTPVQNI